MRRSAIPSIVKLATWLCFRGDGGGRLRKWIARIRRVLTGTWSDSSSKEIIRNASGIFTIRALGAVTALALNVVLGRRYGAETVGLYQLALSFVLIGCMVARLGMDASVTRFISAHAASGQWDAVRGVYWTAIKSSLAVAAIIAVALHFAAPWFSGNLMGKPELSEPLQVIAPAVIPLALTFVLASTLRGLGRFAAFALTQGNIGPLIPGFTLIAVMIVGTGSGATGISLSFFAASVVTLAVAMLLLAMVAGPMRSVQGRFGVRNLYRSCIPLFWASMWDIASVQVVMMIVGVWLSSTEVGLFSMAWKTAVAASTALLAISASIGPKLAAAHARGDLATLVTTARNAVRLALIVSSPVFLLLLLAPGWVMSFFGPEFRQGAWLLVILAVGQLFHVVAGPANMLLAMSGYERTVGKIGSIGGLATIVLALLAVPIFGAVGVAMAVTLCVAAKNIASAVAARRLLGVPPV